MAESSSGEARRLVSLDAFRGFVVLTMVFVNYLWQVEGVPAWLRQTATGTDSFTFADLVFPAFLFIMGLSMPLSFARRLKAGGDRLSLLPRVAVRSGMLLLLGLALGNEKSFDEAATGLSRHWWYLLAIGASLVLWTTWPHGFTVRYPRWVIAIRTAAILALAWLLLLFRVHDEHGGLHWLRHADDYCRWGILGMIGWSYLATALIYLAVRGHRDLLIGVIGWLIAAYIGWAHGRLGWLADLDRIVPVGQVLCAATAIVLAGAAAGTLFADGAGGPNRSRLWFLVPFGALLFAAGELIRPLHGVDRVRFTDAYALIAAGLCSVAFAFTHFLTDLRRARTGMAIFVPVGQSALLAFLLPQVADHALNLVHMGALPFASRGGVPALVNVALETFVDLLVVRAATHAKIFVRL